MPDWGQVSRGGNMYGNPDLKPETSINYELGLHTGFGDNITTALTVFYNEFEDKITRYLPRESVYRRSEPVWLRSHHLRECG